ncbi:helix-turn-helix transcriptional regulator [Flagellimonas sp.]|uniref:helix-turn-helix transcriptional regulator n=1 Tax=Flagellimonas sp. TaxID=2058762 RepID=UPI003F4A3ACC
MDTDFVNRIKLLLEHYELGVSAFADKIGIQRSSMSHILNGRNKPSLDFVMKVIKTFPEVNLYWLLNGKGSFPNTDTEITETSSLPLSETTEREQNSPTNAATLSSDSNKELAKIVFFYTDGTFETYTEKKP